MSANARFIFTNLADTASSITATSTAGSLVPAFMQLDERAAVWRSTSLVAQTLDWQWATAQSIDSVNAAWTNLTAGATFQALGYANVGDLVALFDETVAADTALSIGNTTVQNWIPAAAPIKQLKVVITDAANPDGYVQVSRMVIGKRISPTINFSRQGYGAGFIEQNKPTRAKSRDLRKEPGGRWRGIKIPFNWLDAASRNDIIAMLANGLGSGVWVSLYPESSDLAQRQMNSFWGALMNDAEFGNPNLNYASAQLVFEEMG